MQPREHQVLCLAPLELAGRNERLRFTFDGVNKFADLRIGALSKKLVARLPDHVIDLIEIATLVYSVDSSVSRGGLTDQRMGEKWHRQFDIEMAVRRPDLWNREAIKTKLEETLMFLSDDRFRFTFTQNAAPPNSTKWFDFGEESSWQADSIAMFSGGLVSFAGVLEEIVERGNPRATRTTHPQTLTRFSSLFSKILDAPYKIENPFFWRTKKEVVQTISKLGFSKAIALTRSCADVHNLTKMHSHCGRCSQCVDRRFAMLAAGLERFDPAEAYKVDLMDGQRTHVTDRENALSYVRSAQVYVGMSHTDLEQTYTQISRSVAHLNESEEKPALIGWQSFLGGMGKALSTSWSKHLLRARSMNLNPTHFHGCLERYSRQQNRVSVLSSCRPVRALSRRPLSKQMGLKALALCDTLVSRTAITMPPKGRGETADQASPK